MMSKLSYYYLLSICHKILLTSKAIRWNYLLGLFVLKNVVQLGGKSAVIFGSQHINVLSRHYLRTIYQLEHINLPLNSIFTQ